MSEIGKKANRDVVDQIGSPHQVCEGCAIVERLDRIFLSIYVIVEQISVGNNLYKVILKKYYYEGQRL